MDHNNLTFGPLIPGPAIVAAQSAGASGDCRIRLNQDVYADGPIPPAAFCLDGVTPAMDARLEDTRTLVLNFGDDLANTLLFVVGPVAAIRARATGIPMQSICRGVDPAA